MNKILYSTTSINIKEPELCPYRVTGFVDAESSFSLKANKKVPQNQGEL